MFKNYIKIAFRSLWKHKTTSIINIISLAIGLSASMVIGMMVYYDFTFDKFHEDGDRTYRVTTKFLNPEGTYYSTGIPIPMVEEVKNNFTGVEDASFIFLARPFNVKVNKEDAAILEPQFVTYADQGFFNIFDYKWLAGSGTNQLLNPNEVVLTSSRAQQYFPNNNPSQIVGKTITYNDSINATITGIVADFQQRTDLVFQEFISLKTVRMQQQMTPNWQNINSASQLLVKLKQGVDASIFQQQLDQTAIDRADPDDINKVGVSREFYAQPFLDLHFDQKYGNFDYTTTTADKDVMIMLGLIALFLLLLGCVNFINLNTAQASKRAKEIGIRKTLGSSKTQLIKQFLGETFILTLIATACSLLISIWLIHVFEDFIADGVNLSLLTDPYLIILLVVLIITVTFLAGFYPGIVLSKYKPTQVLKGGNKVSKDSNGLRKFLTTFQFTVAYIFIIATLLVGKQISYLLNKDLGFKTESIVYIDTPSQIEGVVSRELLAQKLESIPQIDQVSLGGGTPVNVIYKTSYMHQGKDGDRSTDIEIVFGDGKFLELYDIELIAGRLPLNDTIKEVVINRTAASKLGFGNPSEALNKTVNPDSSPFLITGVMEDFQNGSLKNEVQPMGLTGDVYRKYFSQFSTIHASIKTSSIGDLAAIIQNIENRFNEVYPDSNMSLNFMDETVAQFYTKEQSISKLLNWSMGLSVLLSCLGLLGLVIHTTERRVKEIGIRKILGATVTQINVLLCKEFIWLIAIAFVIAAPIAYYFIHTWLQEFAVRTDLSWWIFIISGLGMVVLSVLIMSFKTITAAIQNPVDNLKVE